MILNGKQHHESWGEPVLFVLIIKSFFQDQIFPVNHNRASVLLHWQHIVFFDVRSLISTNSFLIRHLKTNYIRKTNKKYKTKVHIK